VKYKTTNKLNISSWRLLNSFLSLSCQTLSWRFLWVKGMMGLYSQISPRNEHLCASHHYTPPPPAQCLAVQESFIQVKHELILWSLTFSWIILKKKFTCYLTENKLSLHYKDCSEGRTEHANVHCWQSAVFLNSKACGTYNHCSLK
jgi:hypothetical protein